MTQNQLIENSKVIAPEESKVSTKSVNDGLDNLVPLIIKLQNAFNMMESRSTIELP